MVEAHDLVLNCQNLTLADPFLINASNELEAQRKWQIMVKAEESFFYQKSRVTWLLGGDSNTSYFHRMADSRKSLNNILFLNDAFGTKFDTHEGMLDHCIDYFANLLGGDLEMNLLLPFRCSHQQKLEMEMVFTDLEIESAFSSLPRNKTSGPDGYSA